MCGGSFCTGPRASLQPNLNFSRTALRTSIRGLQSGRSSIRVSGRIGPGLGRDAGRTICLRVSGRVNSEQEKIYLVFLRAWREVGCCGRQADPLQRMYVTGGFVLVWTYGATNVVPQVGRRKPQKAHIFLSILFWFVSTAITKSCLFYSPDS